MIMDKHDDVREENVAEIVMGTNSNSRYHVDAKVTDITSAQFSAPFSLALTMITGTNGFTDYTDANVRNPRILGLASKVKMEIDPEMEKEAWKRGSRITVRLRSGKVYEQKVEYCKGLAENPLSREEFEGKFRGLAGVATDKESTDKILKMVLELDQLDDVSQLVALMVKNK